MGLSSSSIETEDNPSNPSTISTGIFETVPSTSNSIQSNREIPADLLNNRNILGKISKEYEDIYEQALNLGLLNVDLSPIKETAETLKCLEDACKLYLEKQSSVECDCHEWGSDFIKGEWRCDACKDKCQCDIPSSAEIPIPQSSKGKQLTKEEEDEEEDEVNVTEGLSDDLIFQSVNEKNCSSSHFVCQCGCHSAKEKGNCVTNCMTSSNDDPVNSEQQINHKHVSKSTDDETYESILVEEMNDQPDNTKEEEKEKIESKEERKTIKKTKLVCPCNCGFVQEGEFVMCPCGCGQIVEIVDDLQSEGGCSKDSSGHSQDSESVTTVEFLQMKCQIKDWMISVLAKEIRNSANVDKVIDKLKAPSPELICIDFDRSMLVEYLKNDSLLDSKVDLTKTIDASVEPPTNLNIRKLLDCVLVTWDVPKELSNIRGYEILVNGIVTSRVRSPTRSQAILTSIDLTKPTILTLYSISIHGYMSEPSTITFQTSHE